MTSSCSLTAINITNILLCQDIQNFLICWTLRLTLQKITFASLQWWRKFCPCCWYWRHMEMEFYWIAPSKVWAKVHNRYEPRSVLTAYCILHAQWRKHRLSCKYWNHWKKSHFSTGGWKSPLRDGGSRTGPGNGQVARHHPEGRVLYSQQLQRRGVSLASPPNRHTPPTLSEMASKVFHLFID